MGGPLAVVAVIAFVASTVEATVLVIIATVASDLAGGLDGTTAVGPFDLGEISTNAMIGLGLALTGCYLLTEILSGWAIARLLSRTIHGVRTTMLERHAAAPWAAKEPLEGAALVQLATANASRGARTVTEMTGIITAGINFAVLLAAALLIDPVAAVVVAAGVGLLLVLSMPMGRRRPSPEPLHGRSQHPLRHGGGRNTRPSPARSKCSACSTRAWSPSRT